MFKTFITVLALLIVACSNSNLREDKILTEEPYKSLTDSLKITNSDPELYYRRGVLLYQDEQFKLARTDIEKAWSLQKKEDYALSLATIMRRSNEDSAILFLQKAIETIPNSIALKISLARGYQKKNNLEKALEICNNVISEYPNQIDALVLKSELLKSKGNFTDALISLERAYIYAPFDVELVHTLAFDYAEAKNPKALKLADSLIRNDMNEIHPEPYYFKGVYYMNTGNEAEALTQFDLAIRRDYYFLDAYMEKGQIYFKRKNYNEAIKTFQLATTITPTFADAYLWIGKAQEALGKNADAKLNYQRAYGLDNSLTEAKEAAGRL